MKKIRVRFAPSPTGKVHVGNGRTAICNYLYAKATKGTFVLRIEDTDQARSKREFETLLIEELKWLGVDYDEGPDKPGSFGPYRQSERLDIYKEYADKLLDEGKAYYCFCSDEELEKKKEIAKEKKLAPIYDGKCRGISLGEAKKRIEAGENATIRFQAPEKDYTLQDNVRGEVTFPKGMVGDFIIIRSNGFPVFNFCCALDDMLMEITDVIRGEDHLGNTLRQLMIYDAFDAVPPIFTHLSLLVGADRQKLSKRHGATSISNYRDGHYLPEALANYLTLLGWSHPDERDIFSFEEIISNFNLKRFSKAPAQFDFDKCKWINGEYLNKLESSKLLVLVDELIDKNHPFHKQSETWRESAAHLYVEKIQKIDEIVSLIDTLFQTEFETSEKKIEILGWDTTPTIKAFLKGEIEKLVASKTEFVTEELFNIWGQHIKSDLGIKGKNLFMGMRVLLTGSVEGSDLKRVIPLTAVSILDKRLKGE